jgi:hypothetical protein
VAAGGILYGTKNTLRSGIGRLPSQDETAIGFTSSDEHINVASHWPSAKEQMILSPIKGTTSCRPSAHEAKEEEGSDHEKESAAHGGRITKTSQVVQYSL